MNTPLVPKGTVADFHFHFGLNLDFDSDHDAYWHSRAWESAKKNMKPNANENMKPARETIRS